MSKQYMVTILKVSKHGEVTTDRRMLGRRPTLQEMQEWVDGYVERVRVVFKGKVCDAIVNEDGKLRGLPMNSTATVMFHAAPMNSVDDHLVGNVAVFENFKL